MSKIIKIGQLFLNLQPIIWVDVFFETRCTYVYSLDGNCGSGRK